MSFPWKALAVGGLALSTIGAALAFSERRQRRQAVLRNRRVALIGDSYAVGLGPELKKLFPNFKYEGHVGNSTAAWASHAPACEECGDWLPQFKPDVVLVSLGANDGATPNPTNYQTIARRLHGIGAKVIWIEPPTAVNAPATRAVISSLGIPTVPATGTPLAADKLHPQSYSPWARETAEAVDRA